MTNRDYQYEIMTEIKDRWSPRAFDPNKPVAQEDVMAVLEAARYAPSCFNEQPWSYIVGNNDEAHEKILSALTPTNQVWAKNAPVLLIVLAKRNFKHNDKPNPWYAFDSGTSFGYLTLEANKRGLETHGMGGFSKDKIRELFDVPEEYAVATAIALGYYGKKEDLPEELQGREAAAGRKPLEDLIFNK